MLNLLTSILLASTLSPLILAAPMYGSGGSQGTQGRRPQEHSYDGSLVPSNDSQVSHYDGSTYSGYNEPYTGAQAAWDNFGSFDYNQYADTARMLAVHTDKANRSRSAKAARQALQGQMRSSSQSIQGSNQGQVRLLEAASMPRRLPAAGSAGGAVPPQAMATRPREGASLPAANARLQGRGADQPQVAGPGASASAIRPPPVSTTAARRMEQEPSDDEEDDFDDEDDFDSDLGSEFDSEFDEDEDEVDLPPPPSKKAPQGQRRP